MLDYTSSVIDRSQPVCRLFEYKKRVYKFRILLDNVTHAQDDVINEDVESVICGIVLRAARQEPLLESIETDHFKVRCRSYKWGIADKILFVDRGVQLTNHPKMFVVKVFDKADNHADASDIPPAIVAVAPDNHAVTSDIPLAITVKENIVIGEVDKHRKLKPGCDEELIDDQRSVLERLEDEDVANLSTRPFLKEQHDRNDDALVPEIHLDSAPGQTYCTRSVPTTTHSAVHSLHHTIICHQPNAVNPVQISAAQSLKVNAVQTSSVQSLKINSLQTSFAQSLKVNSGQTSCAQSNVEDLIGSVQAGSVSDLLMSSTHLHTVPPPPLLSFLSEENVTNTLSHSECNLMTSEPMNILSLSPSHPLDILAMFQPVTPSYSPFIAPLSRCKAPPSVPLSSSHVPKMKLTPSTCSKKQLTPPPCSGKKLMPPSSPFISSPSSSTPPNLPRIPPVLESLPTNRTDYSIKLHLEAGSRRLRNKSNQTDNSTDNTRLHAFEVPDTHCPSAVLRGGPCTSNKSTETHGKDCCNKAGTTFHGAGNTSNEDDDDVIFDSSSSRLYPHMIKSRRSMRLVELKRNKRSNDQRTVVESDQEDEDDIDEEEESSLRRPTLTHISRKRYREKRAEEDNDERSRRKDDDDDDYDYDYDDDDVSSDTSTRNVECQTVVTSKKVSLSRVCPPGHVTSKDGCSRQMCSPGYVNTITVSPENNSINIERVVSTEPVSSPPIKRRSFFGGWLSKLGFN